MFSLFHFYFLIICAFLGHSFHLTFEGLPSWLFYVVYSLAVFVPGLALTVRRLHDIGKSGLNVFYVFIPIIGSILLLVWMIINSDEGENDYGPNPKEAVDTEKQPGLFWNHYQKAYNDELILTFVICILLGEIVRYLIMNGIVHDIFSITWLLLNVISILAMSTLPLFLSVFVIRKEKIQIVVFILGSFYFFYRISENMM